MEPAQSHKVTENKTDMCRQKIPRSLHEEEKNVPCLPLWLKHSLQHVLLLSLEVCFPAVKNSHLPEVSVAADFYFIFSFLSNFVTDRVPVCGNRDSEWSF